MLAVVSPAKSLNFATRPPTRKFSEPEFVSDSQELIKRLRQIDPPGLSRLMGISDNLADLNHRRYAEWSNTFTPGEAKPAVTAFTGDVYMGLQAADFSERDFTYAQKHLRILSGLHGLLRPLDLIHPYRLEMGTRLDTRRGENLYEFWGNKVTDALNQAIADQKQQVLVNLASNEYFKAVNPERLDARIINVSFLDQKNGNYKFLSFFAKKARGLMARYLIKNRITSLKRLKSFDSDGYYFSSERSKGDRWVFLRDEAQR